MNKEQIEELGKILVTMKNTISESEAMIEDYMQCKSEVSKKYLAVAIKKHSQNISTLMPTSLFEQQ